MQFIKLTVKNPMVLHGFDKDNKEILENAKEYPATTKLIAIARIKSLCKDKVLIEYAYGRLIFWEYEESFEDVERGLMAAGLVV